MGRKKKSESKILTEAELKLMTILWSLNEATVHQVMDHLPNEDNYAYNTVSTIIRVLEKKEFLQSRKSGRSHVYFPIVSKAEYETIGVNNMVDGLFGGTPLALVRRLLGAGQLSESDVQELKTLLDEKE